MEETGILFNSLIFKWLIQKGEMINGMQCQQECRNSESVYCSFTGSCFINPDMKYALQRIGLHGGLTEIRPPPKKKLLLFQSSWDDPR